MICHYTKKVVTCFKITVNDVLSAPITTNGILPSNRLKLQFPMSAISTVCFFN